MQVLMRAICYRSLDLSGCVECTSALNLTRSLFAKTHIFAHVADHPIGELAFAIQENDDLSSLTFGSRLRTAECAEDNGC